MQYVCLQCGHHGPRKKITKGSLFVELFLWLIFLLPGFIYSIWRHASRYFGCPKCGAPNVIPEDSPVAKKFLAG